MQNDVIQEGSQSFFCVISRWSQLGSLWLVAALAILCFKYAPLYWPFALLALFGYICVILWKKTGLILSIATLAYSLYVALSSFTEGLWLTFFLGAIALSWFLIYFEGERTDQLSASNEQSLSALQAELCALKQQLMTSQIQKSHLEQLQKEKAELVDALKLSQIQRGHLEQLQKEKAELVDALNLSQSTCIQLQEQRSVPSTVVPSAEEVAQLKQLKQEYRVLRTHFEEKSAILDAAKKELFQLDGALHVLKEQQKEEGLQTPEEIALLSRELAQLEQECRSLEHHIASLYEFISLLVPFARARLDTK